MSNSISNIVLTNLMQLDHPFFVGNLTDNLALSQLRNIHLFVFYYLICLISSWNYSRLPGFFDFELVHFFRGKQSKSRDLTIDSRDFWFWLSQEVLTDPANKLFDEGMEAFQKYYMAKYQTVFLPPYLLYEFKKISGVAPLALAEALEDLFDCRQKYTIEAQGRIFPVNYCKFF